MFQGAGIKMEKFLIVAHKCKPDFRIHNGDAEELLVDMTKLCLIGFQEVTSCRNVEKEIFHCEIRAH